MNIYSKQSFYQKKVGIIYLFILIIGTIASLIVPPSEAAEVEQQLVIPNEAIRLRILANSDSDTDQEIKQAVRDAVNAEITKWVEQLTSIDDARTIITSQMDEIEKIAQQQLEDAGVSQSVKVEFGRVQFPTKLYGDILYPAGSYEAILITLGSGKGSNWWCVLFPPLCFLDFSNSLAVQQGFEEDPVVEEEEGEHGPALDENVHHDNDTKEQSLFVEEDEDEIKVKFFFAELFHKLF